MSSPPLPAPDRALARATRLQRAIHTLRSEGDSRARESAAVGTGLLIGCTPFWGTHFFLCWGAGSLLRLNRLKLYLAANIINPLILPPLIYAEIQTGAWLRRGEMVALSRDAFTTMSPWQFGGDLVLGSLAVGALVGLAGAVVTFLARRPAADPFFRQLSRRAADRYIDAGVTSWEFGRAKLSSDPVYRHVLDRLVSGARGTLVDLGCGQGLMLALVAEAQANGASGAWPADRPPPPAFERLLGVETRTKVAAIAARALQDEAEVLTGDIRNEGLPSADVVLLFDVLHMVPAEDHGPLLRTIRCALAPGGRLYIREADAAAGWRFAMVSCGNRLKALVMRNFGQRFVFRTASAWLAVLDDADYSAEVMPMGTGTPFGNVLILATPRGR